MNLLPSLLSPIKIKSLELVNRVVMPPMGTNLGNQDGTVSEANLAYIRRRARGGAGLIITEISSVHPSGSAIGNELGAYDDRFISGLKKIADAVHAAGSKVASLRPGARTCPDTRRAQDGHRRFRVEFRHPRSPRQAGVRGRTPGPRRPTPPSRST